MALTGDNRPEVTDSGYVSVLKSFLVTSLGSFLIRTLTELTPDVRYPELSIESQVWTHAVAFYAGYLAATFAMRLGRKWTPFLYGGALLVVVITSSLCPLSGRVLSCVVGGLVPNILPRYISVGVEDLMQVTKEGVSSSFFANLLLLTWETWTCPSWKFWYLFKGTLLIICILNYTPDSPRSLLMRGAKEEAFKALAWLRGVSTEDEDGAIASEVERIETSIGGSRVRTTTKLSVRSVLRPLALSVALLAFYFLDGVRIFLSYALEVAKSVDGLPSLDPHLTSKIIGVLYVMFPIYMPILFMKFGGEPLLSITGTGLDVYDVTCGVFGMLWDLQHESRVGDGLGWLPLASFAIYPFYRAIGNME